MGATIDTGKKGSVNVHLNIVPFIDLMSCLTAFLLVTAVWSNLSQIPIEPQGISRIPDDEDTKSEIVKASVLVGDSEIWVGLSRVNDFRRIEKTGPEHDWEALRQTLVAHKKSSYFIDRTDIEIAADDNVTYSNLITAMDTAIAAGFDDVGLADRQWLSARPQL